MISQRGELLPASPIRKLSTYANIAKKKGKEVLHLNIGQPDLLSPTSSINSLKNIQNSFIPYTSSEGNPSLREAISQSYAKKNLNINADNILITQGASEGIIIAFFCTCEYGDEVLLFEPYYSNYEAFANSCGVNVNTVTCQLDNNFKLPDSDSIEKKITAKTKVIFLCNPGNPTGSIYSKEEINTVVKLALKHNLFIFSDEVYANLIYDNLKHYSLLEWSDNEVAQKIIIADSFSKRFNLCGARLGFLATKNKKLYQNCLKYAQARLSASFISQQMVEETLKKTPKKYYHIIQKEYALRRDVMINHLSKIEGVKVSKPNGAFYLMAKLPIDDSTKFCTFLLQDFEFNNRTIMLAPGDGFYFSKDLGKDEVRIAFVLEKNKLELASKILDEALKAYKKS